MIVYEDYDRHKLYGPRPWKYCFYRPVGLTQGLDQAYATTVTNNILFFAPEFDEEVLRPDAYVKVWDVPWRWYCQSCLAASGNYRDLFRTDYARRENLLGQGNREHGGWDTPTVQQQDQMVAHAKQHEIMYAWAKGLK